MKLQNLLLVILTISLFFLLKCSNTQLVKENLKSTKQDQYQVTENFALHLFFGIKPIWGDASISGTTKDFYTEANKKSVKKVIMYSKEYSVYWYAYPPFSFLFTPVRTELIGQVEN